MADVQHCRGRYYLYYLYYAELGYPSFPEVRVFSELVVHCPELRRLRLTLPLLETNMRISRHISNPMELYVLVDSTALHCNAITMHGLTCFSAWELRDVWKAIVYRTRCSHTTILNYRTYYVLPQIVFRVQDK